MTREPPRLSLPDAAQRNFLMPPDAGIITPSSAYRHKYNCNSETVSAPSSFSARLTNLSVSVNPKYSISTRQPPVNIRHSFGQAQHIVDDRVADIAVEIAEFGFGFAVDRDAERRDALHFGFR